MALRFDEVVSHPPFEAPFAWRMGVRALDPAAWLQPDDARDDDLALKETLRAAVPQEVLAWLPDAAAASREVLGLVEADLARRGLPSPAAGDHPIDTAARGIQEDLCVMEHRAGRWILTAGSVSFPTRWELSSKIGRSLAEIHSPVPRYATELGATVDRFFDRMAPGTLVSRLNWSVVGSSERRLPPVERQAPADAPADVGRDLYLRIERQTLRRLVDHPAVCFGIRIHVWPVSEVVESVDRVRTAAMLRSLPDDVAVYKNLEAVSAPLAAWLEGGGGDHS